MMPGDALMTRQETVDETGPAVYARIWPYVAPYGGSKWAAYFGAPLQFSAPPSVLQRHEQAVCGVDGRLAEAVAAEALPFTAFAVPAGPDVPAGRFLSHVLPGIDRFCLEVPGARLAGPALTAGQHDLLERLGWQGRYLTLSAPARFAAVFTVTPGFDAAAFASLVARLRPAQAASPAHSLAILPAGEQRFSLRNRSSLTAWFRARRVAVLPAEMVSFAARAEALAGAGQVFLADASQAGLLGLCAPGTKVLELAPEGWVSGEVRAICEAAGLAWNLFLGTAPLYPVLQPPPFGAATALSYEIPIGPLGKTLASL
jgi:hypothetical protein